MPIVFIIQMECTLRRTGNAVFSEGAFYVLLPAPGMDVNLKTLQEKGEQSNGSNYEEWNAGRTEF